MRKLTDELRDKRFFTLNSDFLNSDNCMDADDLLLNNFFTTREEALKSAHEDAESHIDSNTTNNGDLIIDDGFDPTYTVLVVEVVSAVRLPKPHVIEEQLKSVSSKDIRPTALYQLAA